VTSCDPDSAAESVTGDVQMRIRQIRLEENSARLEVELSLLKAKVEKQNETITRILEGDTTQ